jgi:hypothetical protein
VAELLCLCEQKACKIVAERAAEGPASATCQDCKAAGQGKASCQGKATGKGKAAVWWAGSESCRGLGPCWWALVWSSDSTGTLLVGRVGDRQLFSKRCSVSYADGQEVEGELEATVEHHQFLEEHCTLP